MRILVVVSLFIAGCVHAHPDQSRYASLLGIRYSIDGKMSFLFSEQHKFETWRRVWIALAKAEKDVGLAVMSQEQIDELTQHIDTINFERAEQLEAELHHDVMAHIHAYGEQCPLAKPIIHLGATSCLVTDNADIIIIKQALARIREKLLQLIACIAHKAYEYKDIACLSYTHLQPAQPTTVGKRMTLWLQDFIMDLQELDHCSSSLYGLGAKGTTGTQASFLQLLNGDHEKVKHLENRFMYHLDFQKVIPISGQTYTRKQDMRVLQMLAGLSVSATKTATDMRLLSHMQEFSEPHEAQQVGSSAMPYKCNPILCERVCALSRSLLTMTANASQTAAAQWLERTLDDSANRRFSIAESFLFADAILDLLIKIGDRMTIYPAIIQKNLLRELPFFATEHILMAAVQKGADRQTIHERIREHCRTVSNQIRNGGDNDVLERLMNDPLIPLSRKEMMQILDTAHFVGRAPEQVTEFLNEIVAQYVPLSRENLQ